MWYIQPSFEILHWINRRYAYEKRFYARGSLKSTYKDFMIGYNPNPSLRLAEIIEVRKGLIIWVGKGDGKDIHYSAQISRYLLIYYKISNWLRVVGAMINTILINKDIFR